MARKLRKAKHNMDVLEKGYASDFLFSVSESAEAHRISRKGLC